MTNKSDDKNIESLVSVSGDMDDCVSPLTIKHDKKKHIFTIKYNSAIKNSTQIISDRHDTISDSYIGDICDFITEELKQYVTEI